MSSIPRLKPIGSRGAWEAKVVWPTGQVEMLPVGHEYYIQFDKNTRSVTYFDPYMRLDGSERTKSKHFIEQLRNTSKLIIQKDKVIDCGVGQSPGFERLGYQCIYQVDRIEILEGGGVRCRCISRIADC